MDNSFHGRAVKSISNGELALVPDASGSLVFSSTYHGDRDEHWVLRMRDDKEVARYNCRHITEIVWEPSA